MTPQELEALRSENSQAMTVSVETVAVCGRQVVMITEGRAGFLMDCRSKTTASKLAIAFREALPKKPIRIELVRVANNAPEDGEGTIAQDRQPAAPSVETTLAPGREHGK